MCQEDLAGQQVLLLLLSSAIKLTITLRSPYTVVRWVREVDYEMQVPQKGFKLFYVNLLKAWNPREDCAWYRVEPKWTDREESWVEITDEDKLLGWQLQ